MAEMHPTSLSSLQPKSRVHGLMLFALVFVTKQIIQELKENFMVVKLKLQITSEIKMQSSSSI